MGIMIVELYDALKEAGVSDEKAKAAAGSIPVKDELVTKSDLAEFRAEMRTEMAKLRGEMYRQLWVMAISIVLATVTLTGTLIKLIL